MRWATGQRDRSRRRTRWWPSARPRCAMWGYDPNRRPAAPMRTSPLAVGYRRWRSVSRVGAARIAPASGSRPRRCYAACSRSRSCWPCSLARAEKLDLLAAQHRGSLVCCVTHASSLYLRLPFCSHVHPVSGSCTRQSGLRRTRLAVSGLPPLVGAPACCCLSDRLRNAFRARLGRFSAADPFQDRPLRRAGEAIPVIACPSIMRQRRTEIVRLDKLFNVLERSPGAVTLCRFDRCQPGRLHQAGGDQSLGSLLVQPRPGACGCARGNVKHGPCVVEPARLAVDPAEAERLFHDIVVAEGARRTLIVDEPDAGRARGVVAQPLSPLGAAADVDLVQRCAHRSAVCPIWAQSEEVFARSDRAGATYVPRRENRRRRSARAGRDFAQTGEGGVVAHGEVGQNLAV